LGVDAYGWLHRGTVSCAIELAQGKPTRKHIEFTLNRVRMLIHFGVKPFLVFDGDYLPSKAHTEKERATRRKESKRAGLELLRMGRVSQAHLELQKAVDVTPVMARELIEELKMMDVPYIVAPYEADSQLAYLEKQGIISGIISEDSDLLVFGTKCLLTKLDQHGECIMVNRADFTACREISLVGWTDKEFRMMAMLSGCDYLPGIPNMGLKTAYRLVRKHKVIDRVVRTVQFDGKMKVPASYVDSFNRAERTFMYQWVFCPEAQGLVNLNKVPADLDVAEMSYIGKHVEPDVAVGVAAGDLDPNTKERLPVPARHPHPVHRAHTVSTPIEKQGKPISEFFKPRRTPLAELDPNSFTPSPSQQRLLQNQQALSWSASQVPEARHAALDRVANDVAPSSAPQPSRRSISIPFPSISRRSPKRQRLCSDSTLAAAMDDSVGLESATSRFFSKQPNHPSPSLRKTSSQKKRDDFDLWSDDSVAEEAAAIAASQEAQAAPLPLPKKRKKIAVFADPPADEEGTESQESTTTSKSPSTTLSQVVGTPDISVTSTASQESVFSKGINANFAALKKTWTFNASATKSGVSRTKSAPVQAAAPLGVPQKTLRTPPPEPAETANHDVADIEVASSSPIVKASDPHEEDGVADEEWFAIEKQQLVAASELGVKGSEDLLVPESPGNESEDGRQRPKPKLDLGRFAFAG
jgi:exonuclease 1